MIGHSAENDFVSLRALLHPQVFQPLRRAIEYEFHSPKVPFHRVRAHVNRIRARENFLIPVELQIPIKINPHRAGKKSLSARRPARALAACRAAAHHQPHVAMQKPRPDVHSRGGALAPGAQRSQVSAPRPTGSALIDHHNALFGADLHGPPAHIKKRRDRIVDLKLPGQNMPLIILHLHR